MTIAEEIFSTNDREGVEVEAWGKKLQILPISGQDLASYEAEMYAASQEDRKLDNFKARYLVRCLHDENGNRVFADDDAEKLGKKNGQTINRLFRIASDLNGVGEDGVKQAAKNS